MKMTLNKFNVLFAAFVITALVMGCGSQSAARKNVPDWVDELPTDDAFWGIGIAKFEDQSLGLETATARAQRDIARQINVLVQGMLEDASRAAGTVKSPNSSQFAQSVGRTLINANLSGAAPNARKLMPDGTWWVRVSLKKTDAKKVISDAYDSEAARYAEFKGREGLKTMDDELAKFKSKPIPRSED